MLVVSDKTIANIVIALEVAYRGGKQAEVKIPAINDLYELTYEKENLKTFREREKTGRKNSLGRILRRLMHLVRSASAILLLHCLLSFVLLAHIFE